MHLKEVIEKKSQLPDNFEKHEMKFKVIIQPSDPSESKNFFESCPVNEILNQSERYAPRFSAKQNFELIGIKYDGQNFLYSSIPSDLLRLL